MNDDKRMSAMLVNVVLMNAVPMNAVPLVQCC